MKSGKALCQRRNEVSQRGDSNQWGKTPHYIGNVNGGGVLIGSIVKIRVPDKDNLNAGS
ncbi:MAG: hypothetical protein PVG70_03735 [Desulfobacterales bacterium]